MKTEKISDNTFACGAEAAAHFFALGFHTFDYGEENGPRIMKKGNEEVMITHKGFLQWEASHVRLS